MNPIKGVKNFIQKIFKEAIENAEIEITVDKSGEKKAMIRFKKEF